MNSSMNVLSLKVHTAPVLQAVAYDLLRQKSWFKGQDGTDTLSRNVVGKGLPLDTALISR
jgi:hypothetical protein